VVRHKLSRWSDTQME